MGFGWGGLAVDYREEDLELVEDDDRGVTELDDFRDLDDD